MPFDFWLRASGLVATVRNSVLNGKSPAELLLMAETRKLLAAILRSKSLKVCPKLRLAVDEAQKDRRKRATPLMPLGPTQRLGWLDEASELACARKFDGFTQGTAYRISCRSVPTRTIERRATFNGGEEEVLISGTELLVTVRDDAARLHTFSMHEVPPDKRIYKRHSLLALTENFHIPPAPDITKVFPARYREYRRRLEQFQAP